MTGQGGGLKHSLEVDGDTTASANGMIKETMSGIKAGKHLMHLKESSELHWMILRFPISLSHGAQCLTLTHRVVGAEQRKNLKLWGGWWWSLGGVKMNRQEIFVWLLLLLV